MRRDGFCTEFAKTLGTWPPTRLPSHTSGTHVGNGEPAGDIDEYGEEKFVQEEADADDLEVIYQAALLECPGNPEQRFQQLLDEKMEQELRTLSP